MGPPQQKIPESGRMGFSWAGRAAPRDFPRPSPLGQSTSSCTLYFQSNTGYTPTTVTGYLLLHSILSVKHRGPPSYCDRVPLLALYTFSQTRGIPCYSNRVPPPALYANCQDLYYTALFCTFFGSFYPASKNYS